jgi:hypothetical protein
MFMEDLPHRLTGIIYNDPRSVSIVGNRKFFLSGEGCSFTSGLKQMFYFFIRFFLSR